MVSITRLDPYKRVDVLVRAVAELDFPVRLLIAGEGSERARIEQLVHDLGVEDRVEFLGQREDVPELLSAAHAQVAASTREGFSLGVVEGLCYSNVLLTTPVGGAREILSERFLVEPGSGEVAGSATSRRAAEHVAVSPSTFAAAMKRLHEGYDDYVRAFAELKEHHVERFTWEAVARDYVDVYRSVLSTAA